MTTTLVDSFLRTHEETKSEIFEFLYFLFVCVEKITYDYGLEI